MDQPPAADVWPRAIETEIGTTLCAIGRGKDFDFDLRDWLVWYVLFEVHYIRSGKFRSLKHVYNSALLIRNCMQLQILQKYVACV